MGPALIPHAQDAILKVLPYILIDTGWNTLELAIITLAAAVMQPNTIFTHVPITHSSEEEIELAILSLILHIMVWHMLGHV